ncbi:tRNA pseudouridine(55) synthase TruB [Leptolyngbya cf. ectocarpi LEGE 11479]|uniref:tRNA pseudouridine synthase B n=1 Tax=Leptolyngbya cf. ectocarpi LEGE 11479 TaxID=1828722 RepID=A0A928X2D5_LEPEC|nr:tRNA pseudouridine(55) synthase TruB [Leptolyngbya ectocarpi]MBE9065793.1 tRNA pseudouridine(55) synthase TruB [Leptolyngbya cf. ectocarpi LEGE 11479]
MPDGFLNLHKPAGWTSHDCVAKLRRLLKTKKIGHAGTLDPAATGVLPMAVGRATRLLQYLPSEKAYRAVVQLGTTTETDDLEGTVLTQTPANHLTQAAVMEALSQFQGEIEQIPPMYSAVHINGQRLYDLARRGTTETVDVPRRHVVVHHIDVVHWQAGKTPQVTLDITCGAGTYIRSIARDLGQVLGVGGTLASLLRTQSSGFTLETSISLEILIEQPEQTQLIAPAVAMAHLPQILLSPEAARRWCFGQKLPSDPTLALEQPLRVVTATCPFLGIGVFRIKDETPHLVPKMVFAHPS